MIPPRVRILLTLVPLLGIGWLCLAGIDPDGKNRLHEYIGLGHLLGTLFGQTSVLAAWSAFGPLPWYVRLPLAVVWLVLLLVAVVINMTLHGGPEEIVLLLFACLVGQWLVMQVPLWALALSYGLALRHRSEIDPSTENNGPGKLQFGIRQLMTLTVVVALVLGALRALIVWIVGSLGERGGGDAIIFIFLAIAACVMTLPLVMAALLPRWAVPATLAVLALTALATAWELPLLRLLPKSAGPDQGHFIFINAFTVAWVIALVGAVRLNGYRLVAGELGRPQGSSGGA